MHRSRLPAETISDCAFIQLFFTSLHPRLVQNVKFQYMGEEDVNPVITIAEPIDYIHQSTGSYGKETNKGQPKTFNKVQNPQNQFNIETKNNLAKETKKKTCFPFGGERHMVRNCHSKNDIQKGKAPAKK